MAAGNQTSDAFLGGRLNLLQPASGFRAGLDAVILAAAVHAKAAQLVCDLGAGVGTAGLCLAARIPDLGLTAVEIDPRLAELARENHLRNGLTGTFRCVEADILQRPRTIPRQHFHHVITNPPFHDSARGTLAPDSNKARSRSLGSADLATWLAFARAITRPQGTVTAILPPGRLAVALQALAPEGLGAVMVPLWPREGEAARRVILRAQIDSRAPLKLLPGLALHKADGTPTARAEEILRGGGALRT